MMTLTSFSGWFWRTFAALTAVAVLQTSMVAHAAETPRERPNVILIVLDDFGWADLGCYGSKYHKTPHVDRLAADGMRFTDAYAACPVCSPTRAALMTGKYPARLHLTDWLPGRGDMPSQKLLRPAIRQQLPLQEVTVADVLHGAGYATASIGKWHLGGAGFEPTKQGFDINIAGDAAGTPLSYFAPYARNDRTMPGLESAPEGEYLTDRLTAEAEHFIEQQRGKPFFLYLPHFTVHIPLKAKPELIAKYQARDAASARRDPSRPAGDLGATGGQQNNPVYAAMIESMDDGVGRIMKKLTELGIADRTAILFTSDNGGLATLEGPHTPPTSNAPLREGKGYLYEGGIRVPLIVKWPGAAKPASVSSTPVSSIDILPTILEICEVKHSAAIDGVSLAPLLRQTGDINREALYWHYPHYANQGGKPGGAIRVGDFKLIEFYEQGRRELFNLREDVREANNVSEKFPDRVTELAARLDTWRLTVNAQTMSPNPGFVPNPQATDGTIVLPARTADVHGIMLRYEPLPHKNTLGFWTRADDWASWDFQVTKPGTFQLQALQGCGTGSGGSEVEFRIADQALRLTVQETGGFQNFVPRDLGTIGLGQPGRYTLTVKVLKKPSRAVMDLREVRLKPVEK